MVCLFIPYALSVLFINQKMIIITLHLAVEQDVHKLSDYLCYATSSKCLDAHDQRARTRDACMTGEARRRSANAPGRGARSARADARICNNPGIKLIVPLSFQQVR